MKHPLNDFTNLLRRSVESASGSGRSRSCLRGVPVDPDKLIDRILLDPRAPGELVEALAFYFKEKIKFKKRVGRSILYKSPTPLVVGEA
jgi:hypothetical protein